jgi:hypothetical protein
MIFKNVSFSVMRKASSKGTRKTKVHRSQKGWRKIKRVRMPPRIRDK